MQNVNTKRLFNASCIALTVTAMTFAIRAGILSQLGTDFGLTDRQLGHINQMAFFGFPLATVLGGLQRSAHRIPDAEEPVIEAEEAPLPTPKPRVEGDGEQHGG